MNTIAERVARGAALLDERMPGWDQRIDLGTLTIGSFCRCVLGQLHGNYLEGLLAMGGADDDECMDFEIDRGFMWPEATDDEDAEIDALDAEWRRVIEARRAGGAK